MEGLKIKIIIAFIVSLTFISPLQAACYADYKARKYNPFRLHYGVLLLYDEDCAEEMKSVTKSRVYFRLEQAGWMLLDVMNVFDNTGLEKRKESAGKYYLKF